MIWQRYRFTFISVVRQKSTQKGGNKMVERSALTAFEVHPGICLGLR